MILAIVGPTGVGKTKLSEHLAIKYNAIIINCDAVQIYRKLNIGSAKITLEEMSSAPHYMFDIKDITENYSVADYQNDVRKIIEENKHKNIILVGGTGLYLSAVLYNYEFKEMKLDESLNNLSNEKLYEMALSKNSEIDIHPNNRIRLINFLSKENISNKANEKIYDATIIGLTTSRDELYTIINNRVNIMMKKGLLKEVEDLLKYKDNSHILSSAIGYKELIKYFEKKLTLEEAIDLIKQNSRRYAKKQYTWFNNKMCVNWFDVDFKNFNSTIEKIEEFLANKKN